MAQQIIVCDDEPHILRAISLRFTRAGFDVKGATDVESCWRMLHRDEPPAFLIVDDSMNVGPDGLELVRRVRAEQRLADLPIILLTAHSSDLDEYKEQLSNFDIAQIVTKPFSPRVLLSAVCGFLDQEYQTNIPAFIRHRHLTSVSSQLN